MSVHMHVCVCVVDLPIAESFNCLHHMQCKYYSHAEQICGSISYYLIWTLKCYEQKKRRFRVSFIYIREIREEFFVCFYSNRKK